jgi:hypothetical protein
MAGCAWSESPDYLVALAEGSNEGSREVARSLKMLQRMGLPPVISSSEDERLL